MVLMLMFSDGMVMVTVMDYLQWTQYNWDDLTPVVLKLIDLGVPCNLHCYCTEPMSVTQYHHSIIIPPSPSSPSAITTSTISTSITISTMSQPLPSLTSPASKWCHHHRSPSLPSNNNHTSLLGVVSGVLEKKDLPSELSSQIDKCLSTAVGFQQPTVVIINNNCCVMWWWMVSDVMCCAVLWCDLMCKKWCVMAWCNDILNL